MALTPLQTMNGTLTLIYVIISTIIGIKIASKYFKYKRRELYLVGFTWIILMEIFWSSAFSFVAALITGKGFSPELYFSIGNLFVPIGLLMWLTAFTDFLYKKKQKVILEIAAITGIIYYIAFFYFIFTDVSVIGEMYSPVDAEYRGFALLYLISVLFVFLITGIKFALESLKSDSPETRLKGKFLLIAVISFAIGSGLDGLKPLLFEGVLEIVLVINRLILLSCAIEFYLGFNPPYWMKKLVLKEV